MPREISARISSPKLSLVFTEKVTLTQARGRRKKMYTSNYNDLRHCTCHLKGITPAVEDRK